MTYGLQRRVERLEQPFVAARGVVGVVAREGDVRTPQQLEALHDCGYQWVYVAYMPARNAVEPTAGTA